VRTLWHRDRRWIWHDHCSDDELRTFVGDQGLLSRLRPDTRLYSKHRATLIRTLETLDEDPILEQFLDLPAELRVRVYEWYIAAFSSTLRLPSTLQLLRTCGLCRQEVLPVFYANAEFELHIREYHIPELRVRDDRSLLRARLVETVPRGCFCLDWVGRMRDILRS
jgi:hypothetical protein